MANRSPDPTELLYSRFSRRDLLKGAATGSLALAAGPILAACAQGGGGTSSSPTPSGFPSGNLGTVTVGSNYSDATPKAAFQAVIDAFTQKTGTKAIINTVDHNTFQQQINTYLQGQPDDVFTWFAGYRMRFFAAQGLLSPIDDVWDQIGSGFSDAFKQASKGDDGHYYFVPIYNYPWAVFYRKSLFKEKGYQIPKTLDDLINLAKKMQGDGIVPIGFADKDGWPAMGTFDILNMRQNGYDFHVQLMAGKASWSDSKVKDVFNLWAQLLPYSEPGALGRTWQEAAQNLGAKKSGMYLLGSFVAQQFKGADLEDLDFFAFPAVNSTYGTDSIDAPIDGFMMAKKPKNRAAAKELLAFLGTAQAENVYLKSDPSDVAAHNQADTTGYNAIQKKAAELISASKHIAQFLDRDTRPDFASTVMIPSLQSFINNPKGIDDLLKSIQQQKVSIFGS